MTSAVLLLTATVDPGSTVMVARADPAQRLADYEKSLECWLKSNAFRDVVLYENSGFPTDTLAAIASRYSHLNVEILSFPKNESGAAKGKGYSELVGIMNALAKSKLLGKAGMIVKCTGRLTIHNPRDIIASALSVECDVMCTLKHYLCFADTRLFAASPAFIRSYLWPKADIIDDLGGIYFEHALACAVSSALADRQRWRPFPRMPHFIGVSGTHGTIMTESAARRIAKNWYHFAKIRIYQR